ncbi:MAG: SIMPL domain-containing protein [Bacteroidota bacterium]
MSYWTKTLLLILFSTTLLQGQKSEEIVITGTYEWFELPVKKTLEFSFSENGKTCGPNAEFETIGEQFAYLKFELLKNNEMAKKIEETFNIYQLQSSYPMQSYSYEYDSIEEAKLLYDMAKEAFAEKLKLYHHYKEDKENLMEAKHQALKDAIQRAEHIANTLGYTKVELVSIDETKRTTRSVYVARRKKVNVNFTYKAKKRNLALKVTFKMS